MTSEERTIQSEQFMERKYVVVFKETAPVVYRCQGILITPNGCLVLVDKEGNYDMVYAAGGWLRCFALLEGRGPASEPFRDE